MSGIIRSAVLIKKKNKVLLGQEETPVIYGLWNWQQGRVADGESFEDAAIREAKEEVGYDVKITQKLKVIKNPFTGTSEIHVFLGEIIDGTLKVNEGEILQAKWFSFEELIDIKDSMKEYVFGTISEVLK